MTKLWTAAETTLFVELLADYSRQDLEDHLTTHDYWNPVFWQELCHVYNDRAANSQLPHVRPYELILQGQIVQLEFHRQRSDGPSFVSEVLKNIFSACEDCQRKVPVFPSSLLPELGCVAPASSRSRTRNEARSVSGFASGGVSASGPRHEVAGVSVENAGQSRSVQPVIRPITKFEKDGDITLAEAISMIEKINLWFRDNHVGWISLLLDVELAPADMLRYLKEAPAP